ncbi:MAG: Hint domain-containing protein [Streptosporangiaceae bacterium]
MGERLAASCGGASFTAGTKVLLASGLAVPIASLKPGENVLATNARTGKTRAEPVAAVLVHHDTNRYDLTVKTSHGSAVIHTTSNHLFWDLTQHRWVKAGALKYGDHLRTPIGDHVAAAGDFYIRVAATAVLVHNCDITDPASFEGASRAQAEQELLSNGWQNAGPTSGDGGVRWRLPGNSADQVRIMPGNPADPAVIKQGPYIRFSIRGVRYGPFGLLSF